MLTSVLSICLGACAGALLRYMANILLNPLLAAFPLGTLAVNWLGGMLMGLAMGYFAAVPDASPESKLMFITGFLGSLTTFSAFSGEMATLIQQNKLALCIGAISLHVVGSIIMVFLGMWLFRIMRAI